MTSRSPLPARLGAECLGTMLLVAAVVGSGIMAERLTNDAALALLANMVATAAILVVLVTILGPVSGAHLNPAVSIVFALRRELPASELPLYAAVQFAGGIAGTVLAHWMFEIAPLVMGTRLRGGGPQWLAEAAATFTLVLAILGGLRFRPEAVPWLVGLAIASAYWFTASTSFANPAVTFARGFTATFSGIAPGDVPAFAAAQIAGALLAAGAARLLFLPQKRLRRAAFRNLRIRCRGPKPRFSGRDRRAVKGFSTMHRAILAQWPRAAAAALMGLGDRT